MKLVAAILILGLLLPPAASATTFGAVVFPPVTDTQAKSIAKMRAAEVRVPFVWADLEPSQGQYNWNWSDGSVASAARHGLRVLPIIYMTPYWVGPLRSAPPPELYANFVGQVALRYGPRGSFWAANPQLPRRPMRVYELWNEPNWTIDWSGTPSQYAAIYRAARAALHAINPKLDATVGGLAYPNGREWLRNIWPQLRPIDSLGWHPYDATVSGSLRLIRNMARFLNKHGARHVRIDVTEVGQSVPPYGERRRARYLKAFASRVQTRRRVRRVDVYSWNADPTFSIAGTRSARAYARGIAHPRR